MTVICKEIVPQFCCCQFAHARSGNTALCETNRQRCILWLGMGAMHFNAIQCNLAYWIMYFEERLILNANNSVQIPHLPSLLYHLFGPFFMDSCKVRFSEILLKQNPPHSDANSELLKTALVNWAWIPQTFFTLVTKLVTFILSTAQWAPQLATC